MKRILIGITLCIAMGYICSFSFEGWEVQKSSSQISLAPNEASIELSLPKARIFNNAETIPILTSEEIFQNGLKTLAASPFKIQNALELFKVAANRGHVDAQREYGVLLLKSSTKIEDLFEARAYLLEAAQNGDAKAASSLAMLMTSGRVGMPDYGNAVRWFEKAADEGILESEEVLATLYNEGKEVPKDEAKARELYEKAAEQGSSNASYQLGMLYLNSDNELALKWFTDAAGKGHLQAKQELSKLRAVATEAALQND